MGNIDKMIIYVALFSEQPEVVNVIVKRKQYANDHCWESEDHDNSPRLTYDETWFNSGSWSYTATTKKYIECKLSIWTNKEDATKALIHKVGEQLDIMYRQKKKYVNFLWNNRKQ